MKKTFAILVALSLSLMGFAQDKQLFNHLSIGPTIGVDGIGIEVATPVTPYVQLRAGYSIFVPTTMHATLNFGTYQTSSRTLDLSNVPVSIGVMPGGLGKILADIYPWPNIPFHFAAGLFFGSGKWASGSADLSKVLTPDEYATLAFGFNNGATISSDKNGFVNIDAKIGNVLPYIGIGFGHAVNTDKRDFRYGSLDRQSSYAVLQLHPRRSRYSCRSQQRRSGQQGQRLSGHLA